MTPSKNLTSTFAFKRTISTRPLILTLTALSSRPGERPEVNRRMSNRATRPPAQSAVTRAAVFYSRRIFFRNHPPLDLSVRGAEGNSLCLGDPQPAYSGLRSPRPTTTPRERRQIDSHTEKVNRRIKASSARRGNSPRQSNETPQRRHAMKSASPSL